jgi:shikimate kinase
MADLVLVGLPGAGKTTVGRALAQRLDVEFFDTDEVFFERERVSVQDFLRANDERSFRERELAALRQAIVGSGVVATGGGTVSTPDARRLLGGELTVWLDCADDVLVARVAGGDRPLLGDDPVGRIKELRAAREKLYDHVSRCRVDSSGPLEGLIQQLLAIVAESEATS